MSAPPGRPRKRHARGVLPAKSEAAFQQKVVNLARYMRWRVYHAPAGGKDGRVDREQVGRGFPDLVLVRPPRLVFVELKAEKGALRPGQADWLADLNAVGDAIKAWLYEPHPDLPPATVAAMPEVAAYLWRPSDWPTIEKVLA